VNTDDAAVRVVRVSKRFVADRYVLRDIDLTIAPGERVALLGESGSGKSTLLNLIAGLEPPDSGYIQVGGVAVDVLNADAAARFRRRAIGFAFQAFHLLPHLSAQRNVAVPLLLNGVAAADALEQARDALAQVGLADRADALPGELSGGEQQRVALMRALVHRPLLVLADEPTGNLDPKTAAVALRVIEEQISRSGAALLIATHSEPAAAIAHRRVLLADECLHELSR
jgi:putative ABC transport system ATP-binding protein